MALAGCASTPVPPVRYAAELAVPQDALDALPDLLFHTPSPGQLILIGAQGAGSGTALRTSTRGLVVLTNRHVAAALSPEGGPIFAFWPEPEREVNGRTGQAYTAASVRTLFPDARTLQEQRELLARFEATNPGEASSAEELLQQLRTIALGLELKLVQPDLALLQVVEGPADVDELSAAPLASRAPADVETILIYPERGTLAVELSRDQGTLRAAPTHGGKAVATGPHRYVTLGAQEGNSGTGLFDLKDQLCGVISGYWAKEGSGDPSPTTADPWPETPALLEVIHDPDAGVERLAQALKGLTALWKPHAQLGSRDSATLLVRLEEIRRWLDERGVEVE